MTRQLLQLAVAAAVVGSMAGFSAPAASWGDQGHDFKKESETSMTLGKDRGQPGINEGGQAIEPKEGEQTGRPGTIFGGPSSLPPQNEAVQYEGADQGKQNPASSKGEASVPR